MGRRLVSSVPLVLAIALAGQAVPTANAAVRMCGEPITATATADTEMKAKKSALDAWKAGAAKLGTGYDGWRLALDKILACKPGSGSTISCIASAKPCTIEQAPNTRELRSKRLDL